MAVQYNVEYGNVIVTKRNNRVIYEANLYLDNDSDLSEYDKNEGDIPVWAPTVNGIQPRLIESVKISLTGRDTAPWLLMQRAELAGWDGSGIGVSLVNQYKINYESVHYPLMPEWYGIKRASAADVAEEKLRYKDGNKCTENDFIFTNAVGKSGTPSIGSQVTSDESEFSTLPDKKYLGGTGLMVEEYTLLFYTRKNPHYVARLLHKTNGNFPSTYAPSNISAGQWLCKYENISRHKDGMDLITRIERKFIKVPQGAAWRIGKFPAWTSWV